MNEDIAGQAQQALDDHQKIRDALRELPKTKFQRIPLAVRRVLGLAKTSHKWVPKQTKGKFCTLVVHMSRDKCQKLKTYQDTNTALVPMQHDVAGNVCLCLTDTSKVPTMKDERFWYVFRPVIVDGMPLKWPGRSQQPQDVDNNQLQLNVK